MEQELAGKRSIVKSGPLENRGSAKAIPLLADNQIESGPPASLAGSVGWPQSLDALPRLCRLRGGEAPARRRHSRYGAPPFRRGARKTFRRSGRIDPMQACF
jgi:hypothetical protein